MVRLKYWWWTPASGEAMTGGIIATCATNSNKLYASPHRQWFQPLWIRWCLGEITDEGVSWTNTHPSNAIGNSPTAYAVPSHTNLMASNGVTGFNQVFMIWL